MNSFDGQCSAFKLSPSSPMSAFSCGVVNQGFHGIAGGCDDCGSIEVVSDSSIAGSDIDGGLGPTVSEGFAPSATAFSLTSSNLLPPSSAFFGSMSINANSRTPYTDATNCKKSKGHVKRPMNSFMVWSQIERKKLCQRHPEMHNAEISKHLGTLWRKMGEEHKKPFVDEADRLKILHFNEFPGYKYQPRKKPAKSKKSSNEKFTSDQFCGSVEEPLTIHGAGLNQISANLDQIRGYFDANYASFSDSKLGFRPIIPQPRHMAAKYCDQLSASSAAWSLFSSCAAAASSSQADFFGRPVFQPAAAHGHGAYASPVDQPAAATPSDHSSHGQYGTAHPPPSREENSSGESSQIDESAAVHESGREATADSLRVDWPLSLTAGRGTDDFEVKRAAAGLEIWDHRRSSFSDCFTGGSRGRPPTLFCPLPTVPLPNGGGTVSGQPLNGSILSGLMGPPTIQSTGSPPSSSIFNNRNRVNCRLDGHYKLEPWAHPTHYQAQQPQQPHLKGAASPESGYTTNSGCSGSLLYDNDNSSEPSPQDQNVNFEDSAAVSRVSPPLRPSTNPAAAHLSNPTPVNPSAFLAGGNAGGWVSRSSPSYQAVPSMVGGTGAGANFWPFATADGAVDWRPAFGGGHIDVNAHLVTSQPPMVAPAHVFQPSFNTGW